MEQAAANITAEIPDAMVENQCRQFLDNFKMQIAQQGIPYEQYMQITGMDEAKLLEDAKEPALRQVKMDLTVAAIIKAENLDATDEEVEAEYKKLAEQYNMDIEMVKKYLPAEQIKDQLVSQKAVAVVVDSANVVVKKAPAKKTTKKSTKKADAETAEAEVETTETEAEKDAE